MVKICYNVPHLTIFVIVRMWGAALAVMPRILPAVYPDETGAWIKADMQAMFEYV